MTRFIDRSNTNGTDDYRVAGVTHLYLKATQGTDFVDATRTTREMSARMAGVKHIGAYHFADLKDPRLEAAHFLAVIGSPKGGDLKPCLDLERGTAVSDVAWAEAFVSAVKAKLGYLPAIYGSTSLLHPMRNESRLLRACPWWRAEYGTNNGMVQPLAGGPLGAAAHQYTSVAEFPGIAGHTDASVFLDVKPMLVKPRYEAHVRAGHGRIFVYKQGPLWRTRASRRALAMMRKGHTRISIRIVEQ